MDVLIIDKKIKPCPWCGQPGVVDDDDLGQYHDGYPGWHSYEVRCSKCYARKPASSYIAHNDEEKKGAVIDAIDAWNQRIEKED